MQHWNKQKINKSQTLRIIPSDFSPTFLFLAAQVTNYCQVHLRQCKCEIQIVLLQYQYLDTA